VLQARLSTDIATVPRNAIFQCPQKKRTRGKSMDDGLDKIEVATFPA